MVRSCTIPNPGRGLDFGRGAPMKIAHARERHGPAGAPWRLVAALAAHSGADRWLDLEIARRRLARSDPRRAHNNALFRQPITTLDAHLSLGLRVEALAELVEDFEPRDPDDDAVLDGSDLVFGPPILDPPSFRDFYAFERHVRTVWQRRGAEVPEAWYRLPIFYFGNTSELRGPGDPVAPPRGSSELDFELEVAAVIDTPAHDLAAATAEQAIGGYTILNDWSARDLQRDETTVRLGPAKGKDFAISIGPLLVTPDELADARSGKGYAVDGVACVRTVDGRLVQVARTSWSDIAFSFGDMLERASADVRMRPGELVGSGTFGGGCLLESKDDTLGRWLEPGDEVILTVERLGELRSPVAAAGAR
jgi:2-keto-4-pentenoate hydratase/2-oxohepta-3-ene-1,7-dioic acid hydratase in catechol pathway